MKRSTLHIDIPPNDLVNEPPTPKIEMSNDSDSSICRKGMFYFGYFVLFIRNVMTAFLCWLIVKFMISFLQ